MSEVFPIAELARSLWLHRDGTARPNPLLHDSWQRRQEFGSALLSYFAKQGRTPIKSSPEAGVDFYHDIVLRHIGLETPALIAPRAPLQPPTSVRFAELHVACTARCAAWRVAGVSAGDSLCIVGNLGIELLVALLSGLRLGLVITLLPAGGPDYLRTRLQRLKPRYVALEPHYRRLLSDEDWQGHILPQTAQGAAVAAAASALGSHTYEATQPAFALYSPLRAPDAAPCVLSAGEAYVAAVRDGLLLLQLTVGCTVAAPDRPLLAHQPALLLCTLLHGGTFLHNLPPDAKPPSGALPAVQILFVSRALRERMLDQHARPLPGVRLWLVDSSEAAERRWQDFAAHTALLAVPAMSAWLDSAAGGCLLFSPPQLGAPPTQLLPAPGLSFSFQWAGNPQLAARSGPGVLRSPADDGASLGIHLSPLESGYVYGGSIESLHHGARYPAAEVEAVVGMLPFVDTAAAILQVGRSDEPILFVFLGPEPLDIARELSAARRGAVRDQIATRLGAEFVPTQIELLAMYPRRSERQIDREWLQRTYQEGALREREEQPLFRLLDRLRAAWNGPLPEAVEAPVQKGTRP